MRAKIFFGATIFLGAFLLFQIEPVIAKRILPWFGGAAAVWIVCLLFFQIVLLMGYAYAYLLNAKLPARVQGIVHLALLGLSLVALRIYPSDSWRPTVGQSPTWHILILLTVTVGLPYFLLSATSPLLQAWYAAQMRGEPYRFYALSNVGSMLALLTYPAVVEPRLTTRHQTVVWSVGYAAFAILCGAIALQQRTTVAVVDASEEIVDAPRTGWGVRLTWLGLAACGSALLLSVTNHICQNVASVPLLWIIPLSLYLLSFIAAFGASWLYPRGFFLRALGVALGGMTYALSPSFATMPVQIAIPLFCAGLFIACMFCHGELARLRPVARELTSFYLLIAAGGAVGALFVAVLAPHIFSGYYELHVALGLCGALVVVVYALDPESAFSLRRKTPGGFLLAGLAIALVAGLAVNARNEAESARISVRNFYGVLRVVEASEPSVTVIKGGSVVSQDDDPRYRSLLNGTINHGLQYYADDKRRLPTTYYGPDSGIGVALKAVENEGSVRVGIIGLGAGSTAVYGHAGDHYTYYDINPLDITLAEQQFTYLKDSPATIDILEGDARLSLESEAPQKFDLLAVDAFSGDSIPVHLLTREAFELYFRHLKPDGVLAIHISNGYVDLQPVVVSAADALGKEAIFFHNNDDHPHGIFASNWIVVGDPAKFEGQNAIEGKGLIVLPGAKSRLWTDDFSNLFEVLK